MAIPDAYESDVSQVRDMISDAANDISDDLIYVALTSTEYSFASEDEEGEETTATATDYFAAASVALRLLAARYKTQFDFRSNDQDFKASQKFKACLDLATAFERMSLQSGGYFARAASLGTMGVERTDTWL
jgi:hypothetical protein